jgi:hypothetical protein
MSNIFEQDNIGNRAIRIETEKKGGNMEFHVGDEVEAGSYNPPAIGYIIRINPPRSNESRTLYTVHFDGRGILTGQFVQRDFYGSDMKLRKTVQSQEKEEKTSITPENLRSVNGASETTKQTVRTAKFKLGQKVTAIGFNQDSIGEVVAIKISTVSHDRLYQVRFEGKDVFEGTHTLRTLTEDKLQEWDENKAAEEPKKTEEKAEEYLPFKLHDLVKIKATGAVGKIVGCNKFGDVWQYKVYIKKDGAKGLSNLQHHEVELFRVSQWDGKSAAEEPVEDEKKEEKPADNPADNPFAVFDDFVKAFEANAPSIGLKIVDMLSNISKYTDKNKK